MKTATYRRATAIGIAMAAASTNVFAEWLYLSQALDGQATFYVESESLRRSSTRAKMWEMTDFRDPMRLPVGQYLSSKERKEYDCSAEATKILYVTTYAERMGTGRVVTSINTEEFEKWRPIVPGSVDEAKWKMACSRR